MFFWSYRWHSSFLGQLMMQNMAYSAEYNDKTHLFIKIFFHDQAILLQWRGEARNHVICNVVRIHWPIESTVLLFLIFRTLWLDKGFSNSDEKKRLGATELIDRENRERLVPMWISMVTTSVSVVPVVPFRWFRWFRWFRSGGYARYAGSGGSVPVVSFRCSGFYHMPCYPVKHCFWHQSTHLKFFGRAEH